MPILQPSKNEIDALVSLTGEGRMQCNKQLKLHYVRQHVLQATTLDELKEVLLTMLPHSDSYVLNAIGMAALKEEKNQ